MSNTKQKGKYESEKMATFTIGEFTQWFARQVAIYNYSKHSALKCPPAEAWARAFNNSGQVEAISMVADPHVFRLDFMPETYRKIHPSGVKLYGFTYWSLELKHHVGAEKVVVKYDPFSMGSIWVRIEGEYIELRRSDLTADDLTYEEHLISIESHRIRSMKGMPEPVVAMREANEELIKNSVKETKRAKKKRESSSAYSTHTLNQLFERGDKNDAPQKNSDIDFSAPPTIYNAQEY